MKRKIGIVLVLVLCSSLLYSQSGTLLMASVRQDGIVFSADSRGVFFGGKDWKIPIVNLDSVLKMYKIKDYVIAVAGLYAVNCEFYDQIIREFNAVDIGKQDVETTFKYFRQWLYQKFPPARFPDVKECRFLGGGYFQGEPTIEVFNYDSDTVRHSRTLSNKNDVELYLERYMVTHNAKNPNCIAMAKILEAVTYEFAEAQNAKNEVGGPVSIIILSPQNVVTQFKNDFSKRVYPNFDIYLRSLQEGKIKLHPLAPNGIKMLMETLSKSPCISHT